MREGLQLGADDYLIKPFSIVDLTDAVNLRLRRRDEMAAATEGISDVSQDAEKRRPLNSSVISSASSARRWRKAIRIACALPSSCFKLSGLSVFAAPSVAPVMAEAEDRLNHLRDGEFGPLSPLGDGKFRAFMVENRLPMAADEVFAPLFACLSQPVERDGTVVNLSAAIGVALFPTHGTKGGELVRRAEAALDVAVEKRDNGFRFYTSDLESRAAERQDRTASLFRAFQSSDFEMRYRLEVECRTERPARIRCVPTWRHPERGMVPVFDYALLISEAGLLD